MFRFSRAGFVVTRLTVREGNKVAIDRVNMSVPVLFLIAFHSFIGLRADILVLLVRQVRFIVEGSEVLDW